jgi:hypothetical protein
VDEKELREQLDVMLRHRSQELRGADSNSGGSDFLGALLSREGIEEQVVASWMEQAWPLVQQVREENHATGSLTTEHFDEAIRRNGAAFEAETGIGPETDFSELVGSLIQEIGTSIKSSPPT